MQPAVVLLGLVLLLDAASAAEESCVGRCGAFSSRSKCQCDSMCVFYGSCCVDFDSICPKKISRGDTFDEAQESGTRPSDFTTTFMPTAEPTVPASSPPPPATTQEPPPHADPDAASCSGQSFDAFLQLKNGSIYAFRGEYFFELDDTSVLPGYPKRIQDVWGISGPISAAFTRINCQGKSYIFKGKKYWRFDGDVMDEDYPRDISIGFEGIPADIDAAFAVPAPNHRGKEKAYFFKGDKYYQYEFKYQPTHETMHFSHLNSEAQVEMPQTCKHIGGQQGATPLVERGRDKYYQYEFKYQPTHETMHFSHLNSEAQVEMPQTCKHIGGQQGASPLVERGRDKYYQYEFKYQPTHETMHFSHLNRDKYYQYEFKYQPTHETMHFSHLNSEAQVEMPETCKHIGGQQGASPLVERGRDRYYQYEFKHQPTHEECVQMTRASPSMLFTQYTDLFCDHTLEDFFTELFGGSYTSHSPGPRSISRDWQGIRPPVDAAVVGRVHVTPKPALPSPPAGRRQSRRRKRPSKRRGNRHRTRHSRSVFDDLWLYDDWFDLVEDYSDIIEETPKQDDKSTPVQNVYFFKNDKYFRVSLQTKRVAAADPPYPRSIAQYWLGCRREEAPEASRAEKR